MRNLPIPHRVGRQIIVASVASETKAEMLITAAFEAFTVSVITHESSAGVLQLLPHDIFTCLSRFILMTGTGCYHWE